MTKKIRYINNQIIKIINICSKIVKKHPNLVVIAMHELFRSLYPYDPYIKNSKKNYLVNLKFVLTNLNKFLNSSSNLGSYSNRLNLKNYTTQTLFGKLWKERFNSNDLGSKKILSELLSKLNLKKFFLKDKVVLDLGCGSGRFSIALAELGVKRCIGVDLGNEGLEIARTIAKNKKLTCLKFKKANVLKLPFKDNTFDFVFCKGVLHHTGKTFAGLKELLRVLKPNSKAFIYLYGKDGIFWNTRRLMRKVMKKIPINYSIDVLKNIGMPSRRTIFVDSWYVPVEDHIDRKTLEIWFKKNNVRFVKYKKAKKTELEYYENKTRYFKQLFGSGELRYLIEKNI